MLDAIMKQCCAWSASNCAFCTFQSSFGVFPKRGSEMKQTKQVMKLFMFVIHAKKAGVSKTLALLSTAAAPLNSVSLLCCALQNFPLQVTYFQLCCKA
jgi:hypothetical protein